MQRGLIDYRARDGGGRIGQRSDGQSIEPVGPVRVQVALDGNLVELLWHARFFSMHVSVMISFLIANDVFLTRIVVVGSVPGQEGGLDPSKGGNGGGSFSGQVTRGWLLGEQVECSGACHRLSAALHLELTVDGIDIRFDSAQCQDESGCNSTIGEASRNEAQYFQFALGQRVEQRLGRSWCSG